MDYLLFPFPQILQAVPNLMIPLRLKHLLLRIVPAVGRGNLPIVFRSFTVTCFIMYFTVTTGLLPVDLVKQITVYSLCESPGKILWFAFQCVVGPKLYHGHGGDTVGLFPAKIRNIKALAADFVHQRLGPPAQELKKPFVPLLILC